MNNNNALAKIKNRDNKNYNLLQKYFYVIISFIFLVIISYAIFKSFVFLKKNLDTTFTAQSPKKESVHFNLNKVKEINNKINCLSE